MDADKESCAAVTGEELRAAPVRVLLSLPYCRLQTYFW